MYHWTRLTWLMYHLISFQMNHHDKNKYIVFFKSFQILIPCGYCKKHYNKVLSNTNMNIEKNVHNNNLFQWTIDIHSCVNKKNYKKMWSYQEANLYYSYYYIKKEELLAFLNIYYRFTINRGTNYKNYFINMIQNFVHIMPYHNLKNNLIILFHDISIQNLDNKIKLMNEL